jgi:sugar/nucleoside kinase (ribokinase family)
MEALPGDEPWGVRLHSVMGRDHFGTFLRAFLLKTGVALSLPAGKEADKVRS